MRHIKSPLLSYNNLIKLGNLRHDPQQLKTVNVLQQLYETIIKTSPPPILSNIPIIAYMPASDKELLSPDYSWIKTHQPSMLDKFSNWLDSLNQTSSKITYAGPKGLYLYGSVGTGKTLLMDLFYDAIPIERKIRIHFHSFMQNIHKKIHNLRVNKRVTSDPIPLIAQELANSAWVICFDEFQVTDVTDAMILGRLFEELFKRGVVLISTSNRHPQDLYQNGIQRASFLPTIELLQKQCDVHSLNSPLDYRKIEQQQANVYFYPLGAKSDSKIKNIFDFLAKNSKVETLEIPIWGRYLKIPQYIKESKVAKISFTELCGESHSAADFLALASTINVLILTDIPKMTLAHRNEARRFITLVDALYENKIKLICSCETEITDLLSGEIASQPVHSADRLLMDDLKLSTEEIKSSIFTGEEELFAFQRCISRLIEMQSLNWTGQLGHEVSDLVGKN